MPRHQQRGKGMHGADGRHGRTDRARGGAGAGATVGQPQVPATGAPVSSLSFGVAVPAVPAPSARAGGGGDKPSGLVPPEYGSAAYWEAVYTGRASRATAPKEWLLSYEHFCAQGWRRFLRGRVLDVGCGDAAFAAAALDDPEGAVTDMTCIDIVPAVVEAMRKEHAARVEAGAMRYCVADVRDMRAAGLPDGAFDVVFDKSTMDAIKCGEAGEAGEAGGAGGAGGAGDGEDGDSDGADSGSGSEGVGVGGSAVGARRSTRPMVAEIHRVLHDDGTYVCVSCHEPEEVVPFIEDTGDARRQWRVRTLVCESEHYDESDPDADVPRYYYMYACTKKPLPAEAGAGAGASDETSGGAS